MHPKPVAIPSIKKGLLRRKMEAYRKKHDELEHEVSAVDD
jgi:hypothetical protein